MQKLYLDLCLKLLGAVQALAFFVSSLQSPELSTTAPTHAVPSHSVLTPLYGEDVLYALDASSACAQLGCAHSDACGIADLLTPHASSACTLDHLRSIYHLEWSHFSERAAKCDHRADSKSDRCAEQIDAAAITNAAATDFAPDGKLAVLGEAVVLWASFRGQLLARTVRGMLLYETALALAAELEGSSVAAARSKFQYVVSCQKYGLQKSSKLARERWLAHCVDQLMARHPQLQARSPGADS